MDAEKEVLQTPARNLGADAHFTADRSTTGVTRTANVFKVEDWDFPNNQPKPGKTGVATSFPGFTSRHAVSRSSVDNPIPHQRKTGGKGSVIDPQVAGWTHAANYTAFFSASAAALSGASADQPRLRVLLLWGTGTEGTRHGVFGAVAGAAEPTLLIIVSGIEPGHTIKFKEPGTGATRDLLANNRWGVGITTASIEGFITQRFGRLVSYDIRVCAAFSTGYLGLQDSVARSLIAVDKLDRVVIFDCLYGSLKTTLDRIKQLKNSTHVVCYVVTGGGNSFEKDQTPSMATLSLRGNPWHYIDLIGSPAYHAVASARVVQEGQTAGNPIVDTLVPTHKAALDALVALLPARNTVVSNADVMRRVRGALPSGSTPLATFAADKKNAAAIGAFFKEVSTTRHHIGRAQLLGWPAPAGEEWHDLLLVEFGWEYLV